MLKGLLGTGGLLAALAAGTCCVLPISLTALGLGGAWLSTMNAVASHEMAFRLGGIVMLAAGFWLVYARPKAALVGAACATGNPDRVTKTFLWTGAAVMVVVLTVRLWMPPMA